MRVGVLGLGRIGATHAANLAAVGGLDMAVHDPDAAETLIVGCVFRDMHIHDFDAVRWLTGRDVEVYAAGSVLVDDRFRRHDDVDTTAPVLVLEVACSRRSPGRAPSRWGTTTGPR